MGSQVLAQYPSSTGYVPLQHWVWNLPHTRFLDRSLGPRSSAVVGDGLDVVAVGVEQERAVVPAVVPALARRAVVDEACGRTGGPERVDRRVVRRSERKVNVLGRLAVVQPQATGAGEEPGGVVEAVAAWLEHAEHARV